MINKINELTNRFECENFHHVSTTHAGNNKVAHVPTTIPPPPRFNSVRSPPPTPRGPPAQRPGAASPPGVGPRPGGDVQGWQGRRGRVPPPSPHPPMGVCWERQQIRVRGAAASPSPGRVMRDGRDSVAGNGWFRQGFARQKRAVMGGRDTSAHPF